MPIKGVSAAIVLLSIPIGGIALYSIILRCVDRALSKYDILQQKRLNGLYVLSPIQIKFIKSEDASRSLYVTVYECPDFMILPCKYPGVSMVIIPDHKDVLVFMGLSKMLYSLSHGSLPKDGYRMMNQMDQFYNSIQLMGKVDRLYCLNLNESFLNLPNSLVLEKVKPFVGEGSACYSLISSFLNIQALDVNGHSISFGGKLPIVGEISKVLFNLVLIDIFDRELPKRFPGIAFCRFLDLIFIASKGNDEVIFDEKAGYAFLDDVGLAGEIFSVGPGDNAIQCIDKIVVVDNDSNVILYNPDDYYKTRSYSSVYRRAGDKVKPIIV